MLTILWGVWVGATALWGVVAIHGTHKYRVKAAPQVQACAETPGCEERARKIVADKAVRRWEQRAGMPAIQVQGDK